MKKIIKKLLAETIKYILISCILYTCIFAIHGFSSVDLKNLGKYVIENSEIASESFEQYSIGNYQTDYALFVSDEKNKENELWIFETSDNAFFFNFHLEGKFRKTPYLHTTSEKAVGNILLDLQSAGLTETALIYYSHNNDNIALCKYTKTSADGYNETIEVKLNPYCAFIVHIPCTKNNKNLTYEIYEVSFYDSAGNLVFTDTRL